MSNHRIAITAPQAAENDAFVMALTTLINNAYAVAEKGLWVGGRTRTSAAELVDIIRAGELVTAQRVDEIVGAARIQRLPTGEGEFGMFAVAPQHRGTGIGGELIDFAEDWATAAGVTTMQLEVLRPSNWTHQAKDSLVEWYTRIGYRHVRTVLLEEVHPGLQPLLATECELLILHKKLHRG